MKPALALSISALAAFSLAYYFALAQGYWIVFAALSALQISVAATTTRKIFLLAGYVCALASLVFVAGAIAPYVWYLAGFLFITTFAVVSLGLWFVDLWCAVFCVNFFVLVAAAFPVALADNSQRVLGILAGGGIAAILQVLLLRRSRIQTLRQLLANSLRALRQLNQTIFSFYLHQDYRTQMFAYEKKLHENRRDFLFSLLQTRALLKGQPQYNKVIIAIEQIYEIILTLGLLLYRVNDHTTFEVAGKEFSALEIALSTALQILAANLRTLQYGEILGQEFPEAIREFEEINRGALQVVAHEPLVFMLFIHDLTQLDALLVTLATAIAEVTPQ